jgi:HlyD family secretion protein
MKRSGIMGSAVKILIVIVLLVVLGVVGWLGWSYFTAGSQEVTFKTEKISKGHLTATISSTGTIEPEEVIDVGAQIAGQIIAFGKDPQDSSKTVDYRTVVTTDTVLARLDDRVYKARVTEAKAAVTSAEKDAASKRASKAQADREWDRAQRLHGSGISDTDYDTARANHETTSAAVEVSEAAIGLAKAQLNEAEINLDFTVIKSPVNGVIIDRRVNVGQTVVAGLSAPSLFLIAKDLTRVQIWVSVATSRKARWPDSRSIPIPARSSRARSPRCATTP